MATAEAVLDAGDTLVALVSAAVAPLTTPPPTVLLSSADEMRTFAPQSPAVTVFLYHVSIHAETRNAAPPPGFSRPRLPLELHYLVTPWANSAGLGVTVEWAITAKACTMPSTVPSKPNIGLIVPMSAR